MESHIENTVAARATFDDQLNLSRSPTARLVFMFVGFLFLGIGIAGFYTPVLPGTINLIVAAYFFSMSSERMFRWMMTNKVFGQQLQDYRAGWGIPRRVKAIAVGSIALSVGLTVSLALVNPWARASMVLFGLVGVWFILNKPTREIELARRQAAAQVQF